LIDSATTIPQLARVVKGLSRFAFLAAILPLYYTTTCAFFIVRFVV
jgi:hypothetical protein